MGSETTDYVCPEDSVCFLQTLWEEQQQNVIRFGMTVLQIILVILVAWIVGRILSRVISKSIGKIPMMDVSVGKVLSSVARTFIWLFAFLIILDLFGVNTASILTVLGAAGLAIGLAMKDSLSNIAAGLMLLILRPYKVGDYVDSGAASGTIEEMGLFTTTLKTVDGIFISAPNNAIFGGPVKNYSRNPLRRADIVVSIAYGDSLPKAIEVLTEYLKQNELVIQDPAPEVLVSELSDYSVNLNLRFWATSEKYWDAYWNVKEEVKAVIESAGLNIPFPQRVVTVVNAIPQDTK